MHSKQLSAYSNLWLCVNNEAGSPTCVRTVVMVIVCLYTGDGEQDSHWRVEEDRVWLRGTTGLETESVCVCEWERECVCVSVWERESVCVSEREREWERVCVCERECVCVRLPAVSVGSGRIQPRAW